LLQGIQAAIAISGTDHPDVPITKCTKKCGTATNQGEGLTKKGIPPALKYSSNISPQQPCLDLGLCHTFPLPYSQLIFTGKTRSLFTQGIQ